MLNVQLFYRTQMIWIFTDITYFIKILCFIVGNGLPSVPFSPVRSVFTGAKFVMK